MKLLEYGSTNWDEYKAYWISIGVSQKGRDVFKAELEKITHWHFCFLTQVGGDCLLSLHFSVGKFSGGITVWGY